MQNKVVKLRFVGEKKVHKISLSVLLEVDTEQPCEEVYGGKNVLAPWTDETAIVQYAPACVLMDGSPAKRKKG